MDENNELHDDEGRKQDMKRLAQAHTTLYRLIRMTEPVVSCVRASAVDFVCLPHWYRQMCRLILARLCRAHRSS